jgi:hypothetical protein
VSSPTFLLGNHRSGTTWLYSLLAATGHFSTLTAHHVISWHAPMSQETLAARLQAEGLFERALDGIALSPNTPEEYCYILNNAGHKSWLTPGSRPLLASIIDRLVVDGEGRQVLLKNPWDYGHFPALAEAWPEARFIFLHRHPLRVIQSAARVFRVMWSPPEPDGYVSLLSARYRRMWANPLTRGFFRWAATGALDLDVRAISGGVKAANHHYLRHLGALRPEQRVVVRYEDLCASPDDELGRILRFLDAPATAAQVPTREGSSPLLPAVERHQSGICRSMQAYLDHFSYNAEGGADTWSPR